MKLGFGLYRHMLDSEHYQFARQCGATHVVVHLVDYFAGGTDNPSDNQPVGSSDGWGRAGNPDELWPVEQLAAIKQELAMHDLQLAAIENFDPAHWHDVLLDGPKRDEQIENVKEIIRRLGAVGIPCMGYNFSLAGVCSRITGTFARGGAVSVGMAADAVDQTPVPNGMVWNMVYDPDAPAGTVTNCSHEVLWDRLKRFLSDVLPVAEEAGVTLALHPDDPPLPEIRQTPRLVYQPRMYDDLLALHASANNKIEMCLGSLAEMTEGGFYDAVERYAARDAIGYIHFRNVRGQVPDYHEVFVDEGDIDMKRVLRILHERGFEGVLIPDHTPQMACAAPWHAGMAFAMGYMKAALDDLQT